jgi:hypothetical protein
MRNLIKIYCIVFLGMLLSQCDTKPDDVVTDGALEGGLVEPTASSVNYVVGNSGSYSVDFFVRQGTGNQEITAINLYKSVYKVPVAWSNPADTNHLTVDSIPAKWSNIVLEETIPITGTENHYVSMTPLDFTGLKANLLIDGEPLPATDDLMRIGDYFSFVIESVLADGRKVLQAGPVNMGVSTRFAGKYKCIAAEYYRLGVLTYGQADWPAVTEILSVDAKTYRVLEYLGAEAFNGNTYYFQIESDGSITYPASWDGVAQTGNDQPFITCETNPTDMLEVHCGESNYIIKDDVNGKDRLVMSFGYYTAGSGPRVFYQVMEKIVE